MPGDGILHVLLQFVRQLIKVIAVDQQGVGSDESESVVLVKHQSVSQQLDIYVLSDV